MKQMHDEVHTKLAHPCKYLAKQESTPLYFY